MRLVLEELGLLLCEWNVVPAMDFSVSTHSLLRLFVVLASSLRAPLLYRASNTQSFYRGFNFARPSPRSIGGAFG
jgi:hypothetical protein